MKTHPSKTEVCCDRISDHLRLEFLLMWIQLDSALFIPFRVMQIGVREFMNQDGHVLDVRVPRIEAIAFSSG